MNGISVIVCCYNSALRLPETLSHLAMQQLPANFPWEVIVVNNNSTDDTEKVAQGIWLSFGLSTPIRVVNEQEPGLSYAREKGMRSANYDLFLWCDDDNWLCDTYVRTAFKVMQTHPDIGALGGWCEAVFETKKPEWFDAQAKYFAVSKQGKRSGDITTKKGCLYGAGMVTRKAHAEELKELGFVQLLHGRKGKKLSSGEDTEYSYALRLLGYKMWYDERLYFKHFMSKERLKLSYVMRMRKAMAHSNFILWPYLDLLNKGPQSQTDFMKKAFRGFPMSTVKKLGASFFGDFEQKALAKRYFIHFRSCILKYASYKKHIHIIKSWSLNHHSKV